MPQEVMYSSMLAPNEGDKENLVPKTGHENDLGQHPIKAFKLGTKGIK